MTKASEDGKSRIDGGDDSLQRRTNLMNKFVSVICLTFALVGVSNAAEKGSWQVDWAKVVSAAKKEGQLDLFTNPNPTYLQDFQKAFPEIKVSDLALGGGSQARLKVLAERRAGKSLADMDVGGPDTPISILYPAKALDPIQP